MGAAASSSSLGLANSPEDEVLEVFENLDKDNSGKLKSDEVKSAIQHVRENDRS